MKAQLTLLIAALLISLSGLNATEKEQPKVTSRVITSSLSGTITDAATGENLAGVKVVLKELDTAVYTDFEGNFEFTDIALGKYTVTTDYVSYKSAKAHAVNTTATPPLKIELKTDQ
ncbi:carboxypeptidase-like regulatory domain-containing protein [Carboxylicivirga taeanensis]|uniref:carboxypeptidase-like regulatory domain-containing protein n=1 Tax=Carboxylicivirga taeanensis TaxID=1416875 RepID=UPI003F6DB827